MSILQKISDLVSNRTGSTEGTYTYQCEVCDEQFESTEPPRLIQCPECLSTRVATLEE
jgi:DNA-directed RNA polymerase subunit RPC12/RpoP